MALDELCESISVEISQQHLKRDKLWNDMKNITSWCENLVEFDEDNELVQSTHSTVKRFLLEKSTDSSLKDFHVDSQYTNHYIGEICVTYLNFNDFQTALTQRARPLVTNEPLDMANLAIGPKGKSAVKLVSRVMPMKSAA
jgi:hypothetical protein